MSLSITDIHAAARQLLGHSVYTPLLNSTELDADCNARVWLKPECLQRSGSFKFRGAFNALSQLHPHQQQQGVVAWSSGNHAQGVAAAAAELDIAATIVMPADAPQIKVANTRALGGRIISYDRYREDREQIGREHAAQSGASIIAPYDNYHVMAGQGTCGLEIIHQMPSHQGPLDMVLVCCGGGGLTAGIATAFAHLSPHTQIYAVEPEHYDDHARSWQSGQREQNPPDAVASICDALLAPQPGVLTFPINRALITGVVTVSDDMVRQAIRYAFTRLKLVVEPGGAVALAALLNQRLDFSGKRVGVIVSGGNIDPQLFADIIQSG